MGLFNLMSMQNISDLAGDFPIPIILLLIGISAGLLLSWFIDLSIKLVIKRNQSSDIRFFRKRCSKTVGLFLPVLGAFIATQYSDDSQWVSTFSVFLRTSLILIAGFLLIRITYAVEDILLDKYDITKKEDNREERKIVTQLGFLKNAGILVIAIVTISVVLLSFEGGKRFGAGLLTSAGVASVIIGFAAQKTIANFFAGIQIAFTQPIKMDDAVVVEGEWGWIEEINLTYVVVRIWDWRRLILPITYFVNNPFQNWTRNKAEIIGTVFLHLDYRAPIQKIREKLTEILQAEPHWDGKVDNLQVVDSLEKTIKLRALMSARNSPQAWDLRCSVREKLVTYIQNEFPEALPTHRHFSSVLTDHNK